MTRAMVGVENGEEDEDGDQEEEEEDKDGKEEEGDEEEEDEDGEEEEEEEEEDEDVAVNNGAVKYGVKVLRIGSKNVIRNFFIKKNKLKKIIKKIN